MIMNLMVNLVPLGSIKTLPREIIPPSGPPHPACPTREKISFGFWRYIGYREKRQNIKNFD